MTAAQFIAAGDWLNDVDSTGTPGWMWLFGGAFVFVVAYISKNLGR